MSRKTPFLAPADAQPADPHGEDVHNYAVENIPRSGEGLGIDPDGDKLADDLFDNAPPDPPDDGDASVAGPGGATAGPSDGGASAANPDGPGSGQPPLPPPPQPTPASSSDGLRAADHRPSTSSSSSSWLAPPQAEGTGSDIAAGDRRPGGMPGAPRRVGKPTHKGKDGDI